MKFDLGDQVLDPSRSLPSRERGLKLQHPELEPDRQRVAPFAGAWIEMVTAGVMRCCVSPVAPFTGAWIEIRHMLDAGPPAAVAPFTGAWIEIDELAQREWTVVHVAPFTGAWIEMTLGAEASAKPTGRSLHGSLD